MLLRGDITVRYKEMDWAGYARPVPPFLLYFNDICSISGRVSFNRSSLLPDNGDEVVSPQAGVQSNSPILAVCISLHIQIDSFFSRHDEV